MSPNKSSDSLFKKFADKFNFPDEQKLIITLKATAFKVKDGVVSDEQMTALLIVADQYGLNPFTREIFAFPDKQNGIVPVVGLDGWSRIINQHSDMDGLEFVYDDQWVTELPDAKPCPASIECIIYRKGRTHPIRVREFLDEVYRPAFTGTNPKTGQPYTVNGPWQSHTKRLLRHKAMIQCSRIAFGFVGIYDQDEAERIIEGTAEVINPNAAVTEPSLEATQMAKKLILRAEKANAWQAAIDYAGQNFSDFNLEFVINEINQAKEKAEATLTISEASNEGDGPVNQATVDHRANAKPPVNGKAKTALNDARQQLA